MDIGSSFLPSEITAAFLWAQIEAIDDIQQKRISIWNTYYEALLAYADFFQLPVIHEYASNNAHAFYLVCQQAEDRNQLIDFFRSKNILAVFHYQSLHKSPYFIDKHDARILQEADRYSQCLLRLPLFYELSTEEITHTIIPTITTFVEQYAY